MACDIGDRKFSVLLSNSVDVAEAILTPLNARQLNKCSRVCKFWSGIVRRLKKKRKTKSWACFKVDNVDEDYDFISNITTYFNTLYTEPHVVFMMFTSDIECTDSETITECVQEIIPSSCQLIGIGCAGIVGTESNTNTIHEIENSDGVSFLCLPKYENVEFITSVDIEASFKEETQQFTDIVQSNTLLTRVILTFFVDFTVPRTIASSLFRSFPGSIIAGAYIESVIPIEGNSFPLLHMTAIQGDRLQVASIFIDSEVCTSAGTEQKIQTLKQYNLDETNSFAFMFACLGRGEGLYGQRNMESSLFRKYFPHTPLVGLFGNGEIGFNCMSKQFGESKGKVCNMPKMFHSYTTVFVLICVT